MIESYAAQAHAFNDVFLLPMLYEIMMYVILESTICLRPLYQDQYT